MNTASKLIAALTASLTLALSCALLPSATAYAAEDGHAWGETLIYVSPSCEEGGYEILLCTDDGCEEKLLVILDALGHDETLYVTVQPACTEGGTAEIRCSRCGRVREAEIAAAGHDYVISEYGEEVCSRCGEALSGAEDEYHKPFVWLIIVICVGAAIIVLAIVLGYCSWMKANAKEDEETYGEGENGDKGNDGDEDGDDNEDEDGENKADS